MKITVIGIGYVGLVSAVGFAEMGNDVICLVRDREKLKALERGKATMYEPGLEELLRRNFKEGRISFTLNKRQAIQRSEIIVIAVGTPPGDDGKADLRAVWSVANDIGAFMNSPKIVMTKSTVPVGTGEKLKAEIRRLAGRKRVKFDIVSNPEFLREGAAVKDFLNPDRVIVGVENSKTAALMTDLYRPITRTDRPLFVTDVRSAELIKYASNCFLATKISFINEIANYCELVGADVTEVAKGMGFDLRIGSRFLHAGVGYGGSCFPKDISALIEAGREAGYDFQIVQAAKAVNERQRQVLREKLLQLVSDLRGKTIAVWGLSFKPRTDDVREAPSLSLIADILELGGRVNAFDPVATGHARNALPHSTRIRFAKEQYDALRGASALVLVTEWDEFRQPDFARMKKLLKAPVIVDGRNIYSPTQMKRLGFRYSSIGRP